jgi:tetratricopeptide (TPR) repeat protein
MGVGALPASANGGKNLPHLGEFLQLIGANVKVDDAFRKAFQMDVEAMEKELKKYIEGHTFRMQIATFERKLEFDNTMTAAPLAEAEAQAYLGDLLLHTRDLKAAESYLTQAVALDPKQTMAQASLGILRARQGNFAEARKHLEAAVNADSNNYLAHYYYAFALSRAGMDANEMVRSYDDETAATMRAELKRAIALNPNFPQSYSLLGFVNTVTGEELEETVGLLRRALSLAPGRQDIVLMLGQIYLRQQNFEMARKTLEPLAGSQDRQLKSAAKALLDSIDSYQARLSGSGSMAERSRQIDPGTGAPRLGRRSQSISADKNESGESGEMSESDNLQRMLRPLESGEERIQGTFIRLDCDNSKRTAYFIIQAGDRTYKMRATALEQVQFTAYTPVPGAVSCGPRKGEENVVFTFRPATDPKDLKAKIDGDAVAIELVPKAFQLKK